MRLRKFTACLCAAAVAVPLLCAMPFSAAGADIHIWDGTADVSWYDSEETDFEISTPEQLAGYASLANAGRLTEKDTVRLTADVYMNDISSFDQWGETKPRNSWTTISKNEVFLDGGGHKIYGLYGEFITDNTGTVQNLNMENVYVPSSSLAGGIVMQNNESGKVLKCSVSGIVGDVTTYNPQCAGGICGNSAGLIENCKNEATVYAVSQGRESHAGGIVGILAENGIVQNVYNSGRILSSYNCKACGIAGDAANGTIKKVYNCGMLPEGGYGISYSCNDIEQAYYLSSTATKGVADANDTTIAKSEVNMKKESFAQSLGDAFVYQAGDFPKLAWELTEAPAETTTTTTTTKPATTTTITTTKPISTTTVTQTDPPLTPGFQPKMSDAVFFSKWLAGTAKLDETEAKYYDINQDGVLNAIDLTLMKHYLLK